MMPLMTTPTPTTTTPANAGLPTEGPDRPPLRKDAQRTRRLVLDAARQLFADRGVEVGFDEIARAAGVGVGTVYRRFPDRDALIDAVFADRLEEIVAIPVAAIELADPWESVVQFCERSIVQQQRDRGLGQVLTQSDRGRERILAIKERMEVAVGALLRRAQEAGAVRPDLDGLDLALMTHLLSRLSVSTGEEVWRRYLAMFLDSIRARSDAAPLPGPVPTHEMFHEIAFRL
jgi:AcrR family transcriptional regulator